MVLLTACSTGNEHKEEKLEDPPALLEVSIITPDEITIDQEIKIQAHVEQGKEKVTDADEVKFEIWQAGQDDHEMLPAKNEKDGTYSIKKSFKESGSYFIVAHTTANRMHSMPKKEVVVAGGEPEEAENDPDSHQDHHEDHTDHSHDDHHNSEVKFDFKVPSTIKVSQPAQLTVKITQAGKSVSEAKVRYEIWPGNEAQHQFIETREVSPGTYSTEYAFPAHGQFQVKIHIEKGNLHDHINKSIEVSPE